MQLSNVQGPMSKVQKACAECILAEGRERKKNRCEGVGVGMEQEEGGKGGSGGF